MPNLRDGRVIAYAYDATGSRTEIKVTENGQVIYRNAYDTADRLYQVYDDPTGQSPTLVTTYNYNENGNRSPLYYDQIALGATYTYNDSNQLTEISSAPASFTYNVDALGRRANANETLSLIGGGAVSYTVDYAYDDLSRLIQDKRDKTGAGTLYDVGYQYDDAGNRLAKIDNPTEQPTDSYTYWPGTDKLFQINGADYRSYDPNGNTIERVGGDIYEYDYDNMLKRVIKQDGTTYEYYYDPDGNRIRKEKIQNGQIVEATNYIIDANTAYAQVILEIDDQNAIIASYSYGEDILKMSRDGEYFYWYDGLGSVRIITDITGAVANRYTYDAYGNLVDEEYSETITNECKFTGERADTETGFVYLRARMYEPGTGRFLTKDTFEGVESDPLSLHKYLYTHAAPVNNVDPSGFMTVGSVGSAVSMGVSLIARLASGIINVARFASAKLLTSALMRTAAVAIAIAEAAYTKFLPLHIRIIGGAGWTSGQGIKSILMNVVASELWLQAGIVVYPKDVMFYPSSAAALYPTGTYLKKVSNYYTAARGQGEGIWVVFSDHYSPNPSLHGVALERKNVAFIFKNASPLTLAHEIGHTLGLDDNLVSGNLMCRVAGPRNVWLTPDQVMLARRSPFLRNLP